MKIFTKFCVNHLDILATRSAYYSLLAFYGNYILRENFVKNIAPLSSIKYWVNSFPCDTVTFGPFRTIVGDLIILFTLFFPRKEVEDLVSHQKPSLITQLQC
jgi:hypothetical protein